MWFSEWKQICFIVSEALSFSYWTMTSEMFHLNISLIIALVFYTRGSDPTHAVSKHAWMDLLIFPRLVLTKLLSPLQQNQKQVLCVLWAETLHLFVQVVTQKKRIHPHFKQSVVIFVIFSVKRGHTFPGFSFSLCCFSLFCVIKEINILRFFPLCLTKQDIWWQINGQIHQ